MTIDGSVNRVKEAAKQRDKVRGIFFTFPAVDLIEFLGRELDFVYLDCEHGTFSGGDVAACCRAAELAGCTPIARLPNSDASTITHFLDRGVRTLIIPHVETVKQAQSIVKAAYFAPLGERSYGAGRPEFGMGDKPASYFEMCNARTSVSLMIESDIGLKACGEIAAIEGVDYMSFGLFDLAQSLGFQGQTKNPEFQKLTEGAADRIRKSGKPMREDFIKYAFLNDIAKAGLKALLA